MMWQKYPSTFYELIQPLIFLLSFYHESKLLIYDLKHDSVIYVMTHFSYLRCYVLHMSKIVELET